MPFQLTRSRNIFMLAALAVVAIAGTLAYTNVASGDSDRGRSQEYEVSITNITRSQILSPAVVATHSGSLTPLFTLGSPASAELAGVAEDAMVQPLIDALNADPAVSSVELLTGVNGPILPGETASIMIKSTGNGREISLAAMLVTTNDAFIALNGEVLPGRSGMDFYSPAYDAGTEVNNEDCDYIPGPPCGNGGVRMTVGAEGYVYVSNGIQGIGDLDASVYDWNNPVAKITVKRVSDE
ncbi:MAG: spondin domain-containing protein [Chloroflexi bacterium]|nr:spondin domain-containing protein [Chloroflexota bacterium]